MVVKFLNASQPWRHETTLKEVIAKTGATVHPFNNYEVIAGQATAIKNY